jgi:rod shape-determining protein MreB and related proteins
MLRLRGIIRATIYVRVSPNRFDVRHIESGREVSQIAVEPFTTRRLLIGEYYPAVQALQAAMTSVGFGRKYFAAPIAVVHPTAMTEGGLSGVEHRILYEVAEGAGALRAVLWEGPILSDQQVLEKAHAA